MASLLERDNQLLKSKSTALELKKLNQRRQGGLGGGQGQAVDGNLANNNIYKQPTVAGITTPLFGEPASPNVTASTTPTGQLNPIQLQAESELKTQALTAPVTRPAGPALGATDNLNQEFMQAMLDERRLSAAPLANQQGAFDAQGNRLGDGGDSQGTFSVVGPEADVALSNDQFLQEFRADRAAKIARTRQAEALGAVTRAADKRRGEQRKAIESQLFKLGVGRYRANRDQDAKILQEVAPFLSGESDAISDDVASQLGLLGQREADAAATVRERIGAGADIAETQRRAIADQFNQNLEREEFLAEQDRSLFDASIASEERALEARRIGADIADKEARLQVSQQRLKLDQDKLARDLGKDAAKQKSSALSFIAETAQTNPKMVPGLVENSLDSFGSQKEQLQLLRNLVNSNMIDRATANRIAESKNLTPENVK